MNWVTGLMLYAILWWLVLFMVLPFGVRTSAEAGEEMEPGQATSAPVRHYMLRKVIATSLIAGVIFAIGYGLVASGLVDLRGYLDSSIR